MTILMIGAGWCAASAGTVWALGRLSSRKPAMRLGLPIADLAAARRAAVGDTHSGAGWSAPAAA